MTRAELIARLEAATEGSRELDGDIALVAETVPTHFDRRGARETGSEGCFCFDHTGGFTEVWDAPHYTTSLDAKLPWENIVLSQRWRGLGEFWEASHRGSKNSVFTGIARTEPLARRIAALKAMEDK